MKFFVILLSFSFVINLWAKVPKVLKMPYLIQRHLSQILEQNSTYLRDSFKQRAYEVTSYSDFKFVPAKSGERTWGYRTQSRGVESYTTLKENPLLGKPDEIQQFTSRLNFEQEGKTKNLLVELSTYYNQAGVNRQLAIFESTKDGLTIVNFFSVPPNVRLNHIMLERTGETTFEIIWVGSVDGLVHQRVQKMTVTKNLSGGIAVRESSIYVLKNELVGLKLPQAVTAD